LRKKVIIAGIYLFREIKMIIDTNIFIDIFRGNKNTLEYVESLKENIATTIINKYELMRGNIKIKNIFDYITVYNFTENEAEKAAELYLYLKNAGKLINELDIIIAAIAKTNNEKILTKDKDFLNFKNIIEIIIL